MKKSTNLFLILLITILLISLSISTASGQDLTMVRALLFYSPTCGHCEFVITQTLPPLFDQYGDQLLILGIDTSTQIGSDLFTATIEETGFPTEKVGVPFLVVGEKIMVGSGQIPEEFPGLIADAFTGEGIAWPQYPSIQKFLLTQGFINAEGFDISPTPMPTVPATEAPVAASDEVVEETPEPTVTDTPEPIPTEEPDEPEVILVTDVIPPETIWETLAFRFNHDRTANTIAVATLLILIAIVIYIAINFMQAAELKQWPDWILPVLLVIGLAIAAYLASVEVSGGEAICGQVGDCNAVQQSKFAILIGFLQVAVFGMIGYLVIGATWLIGKKTTGQTQFYAKLAMFFAALFGLLFFIYLTFLEPFVIGATCAWCITSALIMAVINLFTLPIVLQAWADLDEDDFDLLDEE